MSQVAFPRIELGPVLPSTEQVHVDVVNELATATAHVHPETIPLGDNVPLCCQAFHDHEELAHQRDMLLLQVVDCSNMELRDDQDVYGGLGVDVFNGHDLVVVVHKTGRCTLGGNLTENTRHGRWCPPQLRVPSPSTGEGKENSRLLLPLEQELHDLRHYVTGPLVQLVLCEVGNRMLHTQILIVGQAPGLRHGPSSRVKHIGDNRGCWNAVLFKQDTVEHTARTARASIAHPGDDDIAAGGVLVDDLLVRRHPRGVLAAHNMTLGTVLLLQNSGNTEQ